MTLSARRKHLIVTALMSILIQDALSAGVPTAEPGGETVLLWPAGAPGSGRVKVQEAYFERATHGAVRDRYVEHVTRPTLTLFHPRTTPNGITLLIVPGGGYVRVVIDKEGFESAEWLAERGFECAVLRYRMPADGWDAGADAPVHDIQRAIRLLRAQGNTTRSGSPYTIGVMGFSAGGHAVARFITEPAIAYPRHDSTDALPARVDFTVLMYPVIATTGAQAHAGSAHQLLASGVSAATLENYSPDRHVTAGTPPTLLVHAADDEAVPVGNSLQMFAALRQAGVRSELHVFDRGGHGFGMRAVAGKDVAAWPQLVQNWAMSLAARTD